MEKVLQNKNIVLTRAKNQSIQSINDLEELGAKVISFPTIRITSVENDTELVETLNKLNTFNTIIFTSENAVEFFLRKLDEQKIEFEQIRFFIISIGNKTTAFCNEKNIEVDFQPIKSSSEDLIKELSAIDLGSKKILIPTSSLAKKDQYTVLEKYGAEVTVVSIYQNIVNIKENLITEIEQIENEVVDLFIFTSPSTFNGYIEIMEIENPKNYFENKNVAVIGPVTKKTLTKIGVEPNIIPQNYSMNYLIEEIKNYFSTEKLLNN